MIELFLKKKHFYPSAYYHTFFDIDFNHLKTIGIDVLMIDLDNTLIPYDEYLPNEKLILMFKQLIKQDFKILIISNNKEPRVSDFCKVLKLPYVYSAKKPLKIGFKKGLSKLNHPNIDKVALIGDQFMTDVFGGNRMGFYTVVVDAIKRKTEKWYTKFNRLLERKVLKRLQKTDPEFYQNLNLGEKK